MDTIEKGRFEDTNQIFEKPINPNFIIRYLDADMWAKVIVKEIKENIVGSGVWDIGHEVMVKYVYLQRRVVLKECQKVYIK